METFIVHTLAIRTTFRSGEHPSRESAITKKQQVAGERVRVSALSRASKVIESLFSFYNLNKGREADAVLSALSLPKEIFVNQEISWLTL